MSNNARSRIITSLCVVGLLTTPGVAQADGRANANADSVMAAAGVTEADMSAAQESLRAVTRDVVSAKVRVAAPVRGAETTDAAAAPAGAVAPVVQVSPAAPAPVAPVAQVAPAPAPAAEAASLLPLPVAPVAVAPATVAPPSPLAPLAPPAAPAPAKMAKATAPKPAADLGGQAQTLLDAMRVNDLSADHTTKLAAGYQRTVNVSIGGSSTITLPGSFNKAVVVLPELADVVIIAEGKAQIIAKAPGSTDVVFGDPDGNVFKAKVIVSADVSAVQQALDTAFPSEHITARAVNGAIHLSGTTRDASTAAAALTIARRFATDQVNGVINQIQVIGSQQVMLQVRVTEVSRTAMKTLGVNSSFQTATGDVLGNAPALFQYGKGMPALSQTQPNSAIAMGTNANPAGFFTRSVFGGVLTGVINALESEGLVKTLAEPNLVAATGKTASMLAGGQYPVPQIGQSGQMGTTYHNFGVSLSFTPTVMSPTAIALDIQTEVSSIGEQVQFPVGSSTVSIPVFNTRKANTTVEVPSGGSIVLGGLLENDFNNAITGLPGVKDIPIIGKLAQSSTFQRNESELVIVVTAYLVDPIDAKAASGAGDSMVPPSDADLYLFNRLTGMFAQKPKDPPGSLGRNFGYITE